MKIAFTTEQSVYQRYCPLKSSSKFPYAGFAHDHILRDTPLAKDIENGDEFC